MRRCDVAGSLAEQPEERLAIGFSHDLADWAGAVAPRLELRATGKMITFASRSVADTYQAGRQLAAMLRPGDVVLLVGELGAGKTALVSGIAEGLGIDGTITSPTFVLVRRYDSGFIPLVHADAYRLGSTGEFEDLDLLASSHDTILAIEWGDAIAGLVPEDHLRIRILVGEDGERSILFEPHGSWQYRPLREMQS